MPSHLFLQHLFITKEYCMERLHARIIGVIASAAGLLAGHSAMAQASDNLTLNVLLADVRSIKLNPAQTTVQLQFNNIEDYQNGVNLDEPAHIEVSSTGGYQVKVKSSGPSLQSGTNTIPVSTITLTPTLSSGFTDVGIAFQTIALSATDQQLITTPNGSSRIVFDVRYRASGGQPFIDKPAGTYVTTLTFSIEPA